VRRGGLAVGVERAFDVCCAGGRVGVEAVGRALALRFHDVAGGAGEAWDRRGEGEGEAGEGGEAEEDWGGTHGGRFWWGVSGLEMVEGVGRYYERLGVICMLESFVA
jgi:hypothetical protein